MSYRPLPPPPLRVVRGGRLPCGARPIYPRRAPGWAAAVGRGLAAALAFAALALAWLEAAS